MVSSFDGLTGAAAVGFVGNRSLVEAGCYEPIAEVGISRSNGSSAPSSKGRNEPATLKADLRLPTTVVTARQ